MTHSYAGRAHRDYEALRGRVLLVFQHAWREAGIDGSFLLVPWKVEVSVIAQELGVSRQAVYRACPELASPIKAQVP